MVTQIGNTVSRPASGIDMRQFAVITDGPKPTSGSFIAPFESKRHLLSNQPNRRPNRNRAAE